MKFSGGGGDYYKLSPGGDTQYIVYTAIGHGFDESGVAVMQKGKVFIGLFGLAVNSEFNYPKYFAMIPSGPETKPSFTKGFFEVAAQQNPKPQTVALVAADQEFSRNACEGARENAKAVGMRVVYDKTYPPTTTDFSPIVRARMSVVPPGANGTIHRIGFAGQLCAPATPAASHAKAAPSIHVATLVIFSPLSDFVVDVTGAWAGPCTRRKGVSS